MPAQLDPPCAPDAPAPAVDAWLQQIVTMEKVARRSLRATQGVLSTQLWIAGTQEEPALNMNIVVKTAADLIAVVDFVTDDLVPVLEDMQQRPFAENHLDFTIGAGAATGSGTAQQILTIT